MKNAVLGCDVPTYGLKKGDVVRIIAVDERVNYADPLYSKVVGSAPSGTRGYSFEQGKRKGWLSTSEIDRLK